MKSLVGLRLILVVALALISHVSTWAEDSRGTLTVYIRFLSGERLSDAGRLTIRDAEGRSVYSGAVKDECTATLPYGEYVAEFTADILRPVQRSFKIDHSSAVIVLGTDLDSPVLDLTPGKLSISVKVNGLQACLPNEPIWAKLVSVYGDYVDQRSVTSRGFALFEPIDGGAYLLAIVEGSRIRALRKVNAKGQITTVEVLLDSCDRR